MPASLVARRPIFDTRLRVLAYELLFRSGPQNLFQPAPNVDFSVITDSLTVFDLQTLTGNARAFVNVDLFPPDRGVVEILETVEPTIEIVDICRDLRDAGYTLALDEFADQPHLARSSISSISLKFLKVDFRLLLDQDGRRRLASKYG